MRRHWISLTAFVLGAIVLCLGFLREPEYQGRSLIAWLPDLAAKDFATYQRAADAIRSFGPEATPALVELLHREDGELGQWTRFFREELMPGKQSPRDWQYRGWASLALGELGPLNAEGVADLKGAAEKGNAFESACARAALIKMRATPIDSLIEELKKPESSGWHRSMYALRFLRKDAREAIPVLLDLLENLPSENHQAARNAILDCLGYAACSPDLVVPVLRKYARSENEGDRVHALDSLKNFARRSGDLDPPNPSLARG